MRTYRNTFIRRAISYVYEDCHCLICGKQSYVVPLCDNCIQTSFFNYNPIGTKRCKRCGRILIGTDNECFECQKTPVLHHTDVVFSIHPYKLYYKNLVFEWKRQENRNIADLNAELILKVINHLNIPKNIPIVNVPPRKGKLKSKGWDQIKDICNYLSKKHGYNNLELLCRNGNQQQKKRNRKERLESSLVEYSPSKLLLKLKKQDKVPNEVILIDDVITTGATIESCSIVLKEYGVSKVNVIILFIVD